MSNRILGVQVRDRSLDPAQVELWLTAETEHVSATTELRGRLTGPRCLYAATVEVAYPLRPFVRRPEGLNGPAARVVIPEPSLWDPEGPFVYQGTIELWEDGRRCDQVPLRRGLRRVLLGPGGLRVNGRALFLHGRPVEQFDETQAGPLRNSGCNLLFVPGRAAAERVWDYADALGFFVLGWLNELDDVTPGCTAGMADHPSCFGWLLAAPVEAWGTEVIRQLRGGGSARIGLELDKPPSAPLPDWVDFIACSTGAAEMSALGLPLLLLGGGPDSPDTFGSVGTA